MSETLPEILQRVPESALRRELDRRAGHRAFDAVARAWNVHPSSLSRPTRQTLLTQARHSLAAILRHEFHLSYQTIANHLHIHPSSPIKTIRRHYDRLQDPEFKSRHNQAIKHLTTIS
jgi:hypothetical protein